MYAIVCLSCIFLYAKLVVVFAFLYHSNKEEQHCADCCEYKIINQSINPVSTNEQFSGGVYSTEWNGTE